MKDKLEQKIDFQENEIDEQNGKIKYLQVQIIKKCQGKIRGMLKRIEKFID